MRLKYRFIELYYICDYRFIWLFLYDYVVSTEYDHYYGFSSYSVSIIFCIRIWDSDNNFDNQINNNYIINFLSIMCIVY